MVLNLRSYSLEESSETATKTDIYFRSAYRVSRIHEEPRSVIHVILGNIGEPLIVDDDELTTIAEGDEETMELNERFD